MMQQLASIFTKHLKYQIPFQKTICKFQFTKPVTVLWKPFLPSWHHVSHVCDCEFLKGSRRQSETQLRNDYIYGLCEVIRRV